MKQLSEEYVKALEMISILSYNKGKDDERRGKAVEPLDKFIAIRIKEIEKLLS